ncbi:hypothetical protein QTP86_001378 [Hemibagrus guttatus]|nr:hypothetical protein QTP86_001378 [Hemibagrus guttatus]
MGELTHWSPQCLRSCMQLVKSRPCLTMSIESSTNGLPDVYYDLGAVFSKEKASRLPPHRLGECAIELLPNTTPPSRVYLLSLPETHAMDDYIKEALAVGHIRPSTSPATAGFFFVEKKDGGLRQCIDYRGLNAITVHYHTRCLRATTRRPHLHQTGSAKQLGINISLSSGYHPQSNGQAERLNQEIRLFLRTYCSREQNRWSDFLPWAKYAQNSLTHSPRGSRPFSASWDTNHPCFPGPASPRRSPP